LFANTGVQAWTTEYIVFRQQRESYKTSICNKISVQSIIFFVKKVSHVIFTRRRGPWMRKINLEFHICELIRLRSIHFVRFYFIFIFFKRQSHPWRVIRDLSMCQWICVPFSIIALLVDHGCLSVRAGLQISLKIRLRSEAKAKIFSRKIAKRSENIFRLCEAKRSE
jgi:hypothetical protein